jgi:hypothetical protein
MMMGDTYDSAAEAEADREQQKTLHSALGVWDRALQRDDCNAWAIVGKRGSIHTSGGDRKTWVLYVNCHSPRHWTATKARLGFCKVSLDGEDEGCLRLTHLPTPDQAEAIRDALGIQKRREVSAGVIDRLRSFAFARKPRSESTLEQNIGLGDRPATPDAYPDQTAILDAEPAS